MKSREQWTAEEQEALRRLHETKDEFDEGSLLEDVGLALACCLAALLGLVLLFSALGCSSDWRDASWSADEMRRVGLRTGQSEAAPPINPEEARTRAHYFTPENQPRASTEARATTKGAGQ